MEKISLHVEGMMCPHCENRVETALKGLNGVTECKANHLEHRVEVTFDPHQVTESELKDAIVQQGYEVK